MSHQQHSVEPMVVARLFSALNLLLHGNLHDLAIRHFELAHSYLLSWMRNIFGESSPKVNAFMLNYLCRYV
jgi:hypothetical protein